LDVVLYMYHTIQDMYKCTCAKDYKLNRKSLPFYNPSETLIYIFEAGKYHFCVKAAGMVSYK
jgi:hypothetical protein